MLKHEPVLLNEVVENMVLSSSGLFFDGTLGFGGHANEILKAVDKKSIYTGTDKDKEAFNFVVKKFNDDNRFKPFNTSFIDVENISRLLGINAYDGIFADLGVSSFQLDNAASGFTFREDSVLDLRMDKSKGIPASKIINKASPEELIEILEKYGEEHFTKRIVKAIVKHRQEKEIRTTFELKEIIENSVAYSSKLKSVTRVFQAIRIYVNNELEELKLFLGRSIDWLKTGGRLGIISFHSLEDRAVKDFFKYESLDCICPPKQPICNCNKVKRLNIITRKPITPSQDEVSRNKRSRSAKLRVAEKI